MKNVVPKEKLYKLLAEIAEWYHGILRTTEGEPGRRYLAERGFPDDIVNAFKLGYSNDSSDAALRWGERHNYDRELLIAAGLAITKKDAGPGKGCYDRFRGCLIR